MADDAALRKCLVCLAAIMMVIGVYTRYSLKKIIATYVFGMFAIGGVLLPDWEFFDRPISQWTSPMTVSHLPPLHPPHPPPPPTRFRFYPLRTVLYTMVYGYGFYKWWMYIST
ncbi:hypothetical protein OSB04_003635 [Centaurea solstitialis]|uniref:Microsomal signal peptidase 12kDa subunit n=1 Tax=Centaurea solstitialis TaxID=347529 RepID=A0AA38TX18_9ASTR|nr:hypothetical protein OSB04_003635 [Centaurea solstitialis]